ncbi:MAG: uncharacterized protein H6Q15_412 [Bacteroidetes bacterium]|nr:uncharacterized protein [Bacteroidota bacterium]
MDNLRKIRNNYRRIIPTLTKIAIILVASAIIVMIFPSKSSFKYDYQNGGYWKHENLTAPFDFTIQKSDKELSQEIDTINKNKKLYFDIIEGEKTPIKELANLPEDYSIIVIEGNIAKEIEIRDIKTNLALNPSKTKEALDAQLKDVCPTKGLIAQGDLIISKNEKIDDSKYQIISSLEKEYEGKKNTEEVKYSLILGQFILISIALVAMFLFFKHINKEIYQDNKKILFILFVIIMMVGLTALIINVNPEYIFITPLCLTPILIRTFFDSRAALYVFLVSIIIIGFSVPNSFEFVFYQLMVGMMAIISMENLEKRSEFFKTSLIVFITYSIIYVAIVLIHENDLTKVNPYRFAHFLINAIMTLFAFPLIYLLEKMFGFISEVTLMEYSNTNSKILRELSVKAPGTFQHCVQVANISEDLIHEIGGNALLTRVGALHHDIGKIMMPNFFIENQNTGFNPHNEITYEESAQVITGHVTDGVKLAHRFKLPEPIVDFIRTHHGTSKTRFFYNKQKRDYPNQPIDEDIFTYKGPKPFTRETAIVMMVDSVEAASRSLKNHTEQAISDLVENVIDDQVKDGQFTNANITFRDVDTIKEVLKQKIKSIYHVRIEYPIN